MDNNHFIYIYNLDKHFNIPTSPESLANQLPSTFSPAAIPLGTAPIQTFQNSGPRTLAVQWVIHRGMFEIENPSVTYTSLHGGRNSFSISKSIEQENKTKMDSMIDTLSAMNLPRYTDATKLVVPPTVLYRAWNEICIRGVISALQVMGSGAWNRNGKFDVVSISFSITETQPYSATYASKIGMLRGISTDLRRSSVWQG